MVNRGCQPTAGRKTLFDLSLSRGLTPTVRLEQF